MRYLLITLCVLLTLSAYAKTPHMSPSQAGGHIMRALAQGPDAPRDGEILKAFELVQRESRAEIEQAKNRIRKTSGEKKIKEERVLELARYEVGAELKGVEYRLRRAAKIGNDEAFDAMKALAKKDLLDTPIGSPDWQRVRYTANRIRGLLTNQVGLRN